LKSENSLRETKCYFDKAMWATDERNLAMPNLKALGGYLK
jgi:hypothetical protein